MKHLLAPVAWIIAASTLQLFNPSTSAAETLPSAQEILNSVRMRQVHQQLDLRGQLRQEQLVIPFHIVQNGAAVRYNFSNPEETLQLQLGEKDSRLEQISNDGTEKIAPAEFNKRIRGTGVTYEDLALKFLYWPNPRLLGPETITTGNCWKLELRPGSTQSQYARVVVWVHQNSGALMRLEGYDAKGQLIKRFNVVSAQKIEDRWFLKQMRIEAFEPGTNKVASRTYLEINKS